jgi:hypothetical protein
MKLIDFKRYEIYDYNTQNMVLIEWISLMYHNNTYLILRMSQCNHEDSNNLWLTIVGLMACEFEELALDGHNYPTWAMDVSG